jgi:hypothetical protein
MFHKDMERRGEEEKMMQTNISTLENKREKSRLYSLLAKNLH